MTSKEQSSDGAIRRVADLSNLCRMATGVVSGSQDRAKPGWSEDYASLARSRVLFQMAKREALRGYLLELQLTPGIEMGGGIRRSRQRVLAIAQLGKGDLGIDIDNICR